MCKAIDTMMQRAKFEEKAAIALNMRKKGLTVAFIAECVDESEAVVQQWLAAAAV